MTPVESPVPSGNSSPVISPSTQRCVEMTTQKEKAPAEFNTRRIAKGRFNWAKTLALTSIEEEEEGMLEDHVNDFQVAWKYLEEAHNNFVAAKNEDETIPEDEDYISASLGEYMEVTNILCMEERQGCREASKARG